jgi:nitrogen-specific signal transduction histidine kinase
MLARPGVLRPEHAHYAAELRHLAERSSGLMHGLIERLPSAPASELSPPAPLADPAAVLRSLSPLLSAIAAPAASVSVTMPPSLPGVRFPAEALERIMVNLVRNAAQAIERNPARSQMLSQTRNPAASVPAGTIRIALTAHANGLHLTVEDDGPGITLLDAAAFLAPSPLPHATRRGLGHRIISELVTATGGTLTVRVRPGRGTRFMVLWPAGGASACTPASPSSAGSSEV